MDAWLIIQKGPISEGSFRLRQKFMTIGRAPSNQIQLVDSSVSRRHCQVMLKDNDYFITDMKSANGILLNGVKVDSQAKLSNGDNVQIGDFLLKYTLGEMRDENADLFFGSKDGSKVARFDPTSIQTDSDSPE